MDLETSTSTRRSRHRPDVALVGALLMLAALVHAASARMFAAPYWLDEAWVALSAKAPLRVLPETSASTPIGWTALVWLFPARGEVHRVVPLLFIALSVAAGYLFARALPWSNPAWGRLAGVFAGSAVLLLPAQQARHDLKQYTSDGAVALLLLALLTWAERVQAPHRTAVVAVAAVVAMLLSHPAALVGGCALVGLLWAAAAQRRWRHVIRLAGCAAVTAAAMAMVYRVADHGAANDALTRYWSGYFPTLGHLGGYLSTRLAELRPALGVPWPLFVLADLLGLLMVLRRGRPATALALGALPVAAVAAGVAHRYPLLDARTSHFLLVVGAALAALGSFGAIRAVTGLLRMSETRRYAVCTGAVLLVLAGYATPNRGDLGAGPPAQTRTEDVRAQVAYVAVHRDPGDVVLVNMSGQYGFAYYWPDDAPRFVAGGVQATGWFVTYPAASRILIAADRTPEAVRRALAEASALAGSGSRIWLVRSHVNPAESAAWQQALRDLVVTVIPLGAEPVAVIRPT